MPDSNGEAVLLRKNDELKRRVADLEDALRNSRQMEEKLRTSEERYCTLFNSANDLIQIVNPAGEFLAVNRKWLNVLGYSQEDVETLRVTDILREDQKRRVEEMHQKITQKESVDFKTVFVSKSGKEIYVEGHGSSVFKDDKFVSAVGIFRDITERKHAEAELLASEERHRMFFESAPIGIIHYNDKGIVTESNDIAILTFGSTREKLIGLDLNDLQNKEFLKEINKALKGEHGHYEGLCAPFTGRNEARIKADCIPIFNDGLVTSGVGIVTDITTQIKLEAQLRQAQKMESIGRLAGGVAHDFNNMLGVILGHTEMALVQIDAAHPLHAHLAEIRTAAERSADLTRQLLAFARKQTIAPRLLDLNQTVDGMLKMLRRLIGENIDLIFLPGTDLWTINMDPVQIDQILAKLCVNARDSIDRVGKITIETDNANTDEAYCAGHPGFDPGEYVLLTISDTGCGMDSETRHNLFEPFYTTKEVGKGTGLGLAMLYGIVKQNNGFIDVYSEPGHGSIFKIYLPRHTTHGAAKQKEVTVEPVRGGDETILLVEDEVSILQLIMMMLEHQGYTVMSATTPGEAISLAKAHRGEINLLITDVVMPEMNGGDLVRHMLSIYPNLRYLFMSGYTANVIAHQGVLEEGVLFIQKPFRNQDLAAKVREALDS
ncbi:MAG: PAS domain S-box protein [Actinomycetia bacterium]|nr:PAS domain S-box protein [Actinomycetes bacterium]